MPELESLLPWRHPKQLPPELIVVLNGRYKTWTFHHCEQWATMAAEVSRLVNVKEIVIIIENVKTVSFVSNALLEILSLAVWDLWHKKLTIASKHSLMMMKQRRL